MTRVPAPRDRSVVVWAGIAIVLALLAHGNTLHNPFVYDDISEIVDNPSIVDLTQLGLIVRQSITRPLTNLSYAADYAGSGLDPFGYHLTNLLLHAINVALLFALVRVLIRTTASGRRSENATFAAFTAAGMFAVHPLLTEGVGYISSRAELLAGAWVLVSVLCFTRALSTLTVRWIAAGVASFVLAAMAKEVAAMLPLVLVAYDFLMLPPEGRRQRFA